MISVSLAITGLTGKIAWRRLSPALSGLTRGLRFDAQEMSACWVTSG
jgi:hypothetical protein